MLAQTPDRLPRIEAVEAEFAAKARVSVSNCCTVIAPSCGDTSAGFDDDAAVASSCGGTSAGFDDDAAVASSCGGTGFHDDDADDVGSGAA
jgi:hypothetical protein